MPVEISRFGGLAPAIDEASMTDDEAQMCHNGTEVGGAFTPVYGMGVVDHEVPSGSNQLFLLDGAPTVVEERPMILEFTHDYPVRITFMVFLEPGQETTFDWGDGEVDIYDYDKLAAIPMTPSSGETDYAVALPSGYEGLRHRPGVGVARLVHHSYTDKTPGERFRVLISGWFGTHYDHGFQLGWRANFRNVVQWGTTKITSLDGFFGHSTPDDNLMATDTPNFQSGATLRGLFCARATPLQTGLARWDVTNVVSMCELLFASSYGESLDDWRPVNVIDLNGAFMMSAYFYNGLSIASWLLPKLRMAINYGQISGGSLVPAALFDNIAGDAVVTYVGVNEFPSRATVDFYPTVADAGGTFGYLNYTYFTIPEPWPPEQ